MPAAPRTSITHFLASSATPKLDQRLPSFINQRNHIGIAVTAIATRQPTKQNGLIEASNPLLKLR
jgi:hypothetical protein